MFYAEGFILAIIIAFFLLKDTVARFPPEMSCLPKAKQSSVVGACPSVKRHPCDEEDHYFKNFPTKQHASLEHFAPLSNHIRFGSHKTECNANHKCNTVDTGIHTPLYKGYYPWSYAYGGQPYGMYRPWWSQNDCNFNECY